MTVIDPSNYTIADGDELARLTPCEFALFMALLRANGRCLPFGFLCDVLGDVTGKETWQESLRVHKTRIDRKIRRLGMAITSHYGIGYSLAKAEVSILPRAEEIIMGQRAPA